MQTISYATRARQGRTIVVHLFAVVPRNSPHDSSPRIIVYKVALLRTHRVNQKRKKKRKVEKANISFISS